MLMSILAATGISFVTLFIAISLMNIRHMVKGEPFRGSCAQNNPMLKDKIGDCQVCGKKSDEVCKMPEVH